MPLYSGGAIENYGLKVVLSFSVELDPESIAAEDFSMLDENGVGWIAYDAILWPDRKKLTLHFDDFNNAAGNLTAVYTPGSLTSMAGKTASALSFSFVPYELVPTPGTPPQVVSVWCEGTDGTDVFVEFDIPLTSDPAQAAGHFSVEFETRDYAPDGAIREVSRQIASCSFPDEDDGTVIELLLPSGNVHSYQNALGDVTLVYDGAGGLRNGTARVLPFSEIFTPEELEQKPDQMHEEHIEIVSITASGTITAITYHDVRAADENVEISDVTATGILTDIGDL